MTWQGSQLGGDPGALREMGHPLNTYRSWVFPVKGLRRCGLVMKKGPWRHRPGSYGLAGSVGAGPVGAGPVGGANTGKSLWSRSQLSVLLHPCWLLGI